MKIVKYILSCFINTVVLIFMQLFAGSIVAFLIVMWFIPFGLAAQYENGYWLLLYIPVFIIAGIINKNDEKYNNGL